MIASLVRRFDADPDFVVRLGVTAAYAAIAILFITGAVS